MATVSRSWTFSIFSRRTSIDRESTGRTDASLKGFKR
jgi:hypothetical protein